MGVFPVLPCFNQPSLSIRGSIASCFWWSFLSVVSDLEKGLSLLVVALLCLPWLRLTTFRTHIYYVDVVGRSPVAHLSVTRSLNINPTDIFLAARFSKPSIFILIVFFTFPWPTTMSIEVGTKEANLG